MTLKTLSGPAAIEALPRDRLLGEFSLWSADLANMEADLGRIEPYADLHHIDVADARYPWISCSFRISSRASRKQLPRPIHVHLMVEAEIVEEQTRQVHRGGRAI